MIGRRRFFQRTFAGLAVAVVSTPRIFFGQTGPQLRPDETIPPVIKYPNGFLTRTFIKWDGGTKVPYFYEELPAGNPVGNRYDTNMMDMLRAVELISISSLSLRLPKHDDGFTGVGSREPFVELIEWNGFVLKGQFTIGVNYFWPLGPQIDAASIAVQAPDQCFIASVPGAPPLEILSRSENRPANREPLGHRS